MPKAVRFAQTAVILIALAVLWFALAPSRAQPSDPLLASHDRLFMSEIHLKDLHGQTWRLEDQEGKVVIVNFWATWCPPCREETPGLVHLAQTNGARGVKVVGIDMDEGEIAPVVQFAARYRIPYPILLPTKDFGLAGRVDNLPTTFLVDQRGRVAKTYIGAIAESTLQQDVNRLLTE